MLWMEAVKRAQAELIEPFELEFVMRGKRNLDKLAWLNLMRKSISDEELSVLTTVKLTHIQSHSSRLNALKNQFHF